MAYDNTYVALDKITVASATPSVTFTSIPQTYTDLVIIASGTASAGAYTKLYFNGVTTATYSWQNLYGTGSAVGATRTGSFNYIQCYYNYANSNPTLMEVNIFNYANTSMYKTILLPDYDAGYEVTAKAGTWQSTSAITSATLERVSGNWNVGTTFSLYGIAATGSTPAAKATGGTITYDANYTYHTFTSSGTFAPSVPLTIDALVVAGGGGGATSVGGGGGGGGLLGFNSQSVTATNYTVTVGAGGASVGSNSQGNTGSDSQFGALTLVKGGGGGGSYAAGTTGKNGGSGGGAGGWSPTASGGSPTSGQGFAGGDVTGGTYGTGGSGGGGGAGGPGGSYSVGTIGSNGGRGLATYTSWASVTGTGVLYNGNYYFAAGGPGVYGAGGTQASASFGTVAFGASTVANTGQGGCGDTGGAGGSGIVIIRYASV